MPSIDLNLSNSNRWLLQKLGFRFMGLSLKNQELSVVDMTHFQFVIWEFHSIVLCECKVWLDV